MTSTSAHRWGFLTTQALVLIELARTPDARVAEIADRVGVTERQLHRILDDLETAGYLSRTRIGRRNRYEVHPRQPLRHPSMGGRLVGDLIGALGA